MHVYKVFDDEWSEIVGSTQLKYFAYEQTIEFINTNSKEEVTEIVGNSITPSLKELVTNLISDVETGVTKTSFAENISDGVAIELLKLRRYTVEELNIY